jgi:hypothetical protein
MPYLTKDDLPMAVQNHVPGHGQDIFREAFNNAWQEYALNVPAAAPHLAPTLVREPRSLPGHTASNAAEINRI